MLRNACCPIQIFQKCQIMDPLYLWINLATVFFPFILSFNRIGHFYQRWKPVSLSILIMSACIISWDIWFAHTGVWGFNSAYLLGYHFFHLPLEEWLFFVCIPYAFMFLYDQLIIINVPNYFIKIQHVLDYLCIGIALLFLWAGFGKLYTTTVATLVIICTVLIIHINPPNRGIFYMSYLLVLLPFILTNGALTGSFTPEPVVWYNNAENLGVRLLTIPIEDFLYYLLMFEICYLAYEQIKKATSMGNLT